MNVATVVLARLNVINIGEQYRREGSLQDFYFRVGVLLLFFFFPHFLFYEEFVGCGHDFII